MHEEAKSVIPILNVVIFFWVHAMPPPHRNARPVLASSVRILNSSMGAESGGGGGGKGGVPQSRNQRRIGFPRN